MTHSPYDSHRSYLTTADRWMLGIAIAILVPLMLVSWALGALVAFSMLALWAAVQFVLHAVRRLRGPSTGFSIGHLRSAKRKIRHHYTVTTDD